MHREVQMTIFSKKNANLFECCFAVVAINKLCHTWAQRGMGGPLPTTPPSLGRVKKFLKFNFASFKENAVCCKMTKTRNRKF